MGILTIYFIRHGTTSMNVKGLFCGRTDALLDKKGWDELRALKEQYEIPDVEQVYCSPAIRCLETASVYYPDKEPRIKEGLWEFDFAEGEKTYAPGYIGTEFYDDWLDQKPDCGFPGGETLLEARFRVLSAMTRIVKECRDEGLSTISIIAHGCILARLMEFNLKPEEQASAFTLSPNGMGMVGTIDMDQWFDQQEITFSHFFPEGAPRLNPEDSPYFGKKKKE